MMFSVEKKEASTSKQSYHFEAHVIEDDSSAPLKGEDSLEIKLYEIKRHDEVKAYMNKIFTRQLYVQMSFRATFYLRSNIFILFCETLDGFNSDDTWLLGLFVYLSYLSNAVVSIAFGSIGDRWRFDYLLFIAAIFDIITFWIEATATNIYTLGIAYVVGGQPFVAIISSWNLKMNQLYYAKQYTSTMLAAAQIGALFGASLGSIIADYFGYRLVFYIGACLACVQCVYCVIFFWDCQTKMHQETLSLKEYYDKYPIAVVSNINNNNSTKDNTNNSNNKDNHIKTVSMLSENVRWKISKDYRFPGGMINESFSDTDIQEKKQATVWQRLLKINKYTLFLIGSFYFVSAAIFSTEAAILTYYSVYIKHKLNGTLLISGLQLGLYCLGNMIASRLVKKLVAYIEKQKILKMQSNTGVRYNLTNILMLLGCVCIITSGFICGILVTADSDR